MALRGPRFLYLEGACMTAHNLDYGSESYCYIAGEQLRLRTAMTRTIRPHAAETNAAFEQRMDTMALQLSAMSSVASVSLRFERKADRLTLCEVSIIEFPHPVPIAPDERPAGGRANLRLIK
jgi:hypothetical protein